MDLLCRASRQFGKTTGLIKRLIKSSHRNVACRLGLALGHIPITPFLRTWPSGPSYLLWVPARCVQDRRRVRSLKPRGNTAGELHEWRSPQCFVNAPIQTVRNPLSLEKDDFFVFMRAIRRARNLRARILCVTFGFAICAHEAIRLSIAKANAC
jgi:hypothetical protein